MNRRKFLHILSGCAMAGSLPMSLIRPAFGATADRFLITVSATGGWDPTSLMDPKGDALRSDGLGPVNNYSASEINSIGNIQYAPYATSIDLPDADSMGDFDNFFAKHYQRLLIINGIDTQTNGHESGRRFVWSGKLETGYPSITALAAAPFADQPMAFISNGGYDYTASLVAPVRTASVGTFNYLAYPNSQFPEQENLRDQQYFSDPTYVKIQQARSARLQRLQAYHSLPRVQNQLQQLEKVRSSDIELESLLAELPATVSDGFKGQAEVALAAFAGGLAVSANLHAGGFDTHGDHDIDQTQALVELLDGIDHLWEQIVAHNLQDKVTVLIGSDFGRTPFYNSGAGKDHWNVTSIMVMGAGITGNRVIGATDENFEVRKMNVSTLEADSNGIIVTPQHIHQAIRKFLSVPDDLIAQFPINVETLDLFN